MGGMVIALKILVLGMMGFLCYLSAVTHIRVETYKDVLAICVLLPSTFLWLRQIGKVIKDAR